MGTPLWYRFRPPGGDDAFEVWAVACVVVLALLWLFGKP